MKANPNNFCGGNFQDWLEVNLIDKCNGNCSWCVEKRGFHPKYHAPYPVLASAAINSGKSNIILLGGEPTLYKDISPLIQELVRHNKKVYITTNGSLLTPQYVKDNLEGIAGANISIHHYDLDKNAEVTGIKLDARILSDSLRTMWNMAIGIRFNCNCIQGYIDSEKEIENYINWAKNLIVNKVRFAELKFDEDHFVDLAKIMDYKYGLNDNPFVCGCNQDAVINGMPVNFRQMCGLQTSLRPQHVNTERHPKTVLYYDGKIYDGWQIQKQAKEKNMNTKELVKLLENVKNGEISVAEAAVIIRTEELEKEVRAAEGSESANCTY
jgi:pyruvate-formate lyase-activating enzyme